VQVSGILLMHRHVLPLACAAIIAAASVAASPRAEFNAAYRAYGEAIAESRYRDAVKHASDALEYADDVVGKKSPEMAILTFNHGYALAKAGRVLDAYRTLIGARTLVEKAFGRNAAELIQVEIELAHTGLPHQVVAHLERALELAARHHGEASEFVADIKVEGATRISKDRAVELLEGAAEAYRRLGKTGKHAVAQYWLGKRHIDDGRHGEAIGPMSAIVEAQAADPELVLMARRALVGALERMGQSDRATEHCLAIGSATTWTSVENYEPIHEREPAYPQAKQAARVAGTVLISFDVDAEGRVRNPIVLSSMGGSEFENAALHAISGYRYAPRFVDGSPVPVTGVEHRIEFLPDR